MKKRVMVVEDEVFVGVDITEQLVEGGFDAVGPFATVADAMLEFMTNGCDVAVLDVKLKHETSAVFAAFLKARGVPFVIISGYCNTQFPTAFAGAISLNKPTRIGALIDAINEVL